MSPKRPTAQSSRTNKRLPPGQTIPDADSEAEADDGPNANKAQTKRGSPKKRTPRGRGGIRKVAVESELSEEGDSEHVTPNNLKETRPLPRRMEKSPMKAVVMIRSPAKSGQRPRKDDDDKSDTSLSTAPSPSRPGSALLAGRENQAKSKTLPHPSPPPNATEGAVAAVTPVPDVAKPPRPDKFHVVGAPISKPEFDYVIFVVMSSREAGLEDLNDFESDDFRAPEIYEAWQATGEPPTFEKFNTARKGKGRADVPTHTAPQVSTKSSSPPAAQSDKLADALGSKFGLAKESMDALSSKAITKALHLSDGLKDPAALAKPKQYKKKLSATALSEMSVVIDEAVHALAQIAVKHGNDPVVATTLFQKKLSFFTGSLWDMYQMSGAIRRSAKADGVDIGNGNGNDDQAAAEGEEEDVEEDGEHEDDEEDEEDGKDHSVDRARKLRGKQAKLDAVSYAKEMAEAKAAGPQAYDTWAAKVVADGYSSIARLTTPNEKTRIREASSAANAFDSFSRQLWNIYGLVATGFITGATGPLPSDYKGNWVFGPNHAVKSVFYNGALVHSTQQLYMQNGFGSVYTADVLAGSIPVPPPILPAVTYPKYAAQGVAVKQDRPLAPLVSKASKSEPAGSSSIKEAAEVQFMELMADSLEIIPGSPEGDKFVNNLKTTLPVIAKGKMCGENILYARIAKAHWKRALGAVSRSKEDGGDHKLVIEQKELRRDALGRSKYHAFQLLGFPVGFEYPENAGVIGNSPGRTESKSSALAYALIQACICGHKGEDGTREFFRFEKMEWDLDVLNRRRNADLVLNTDHTSILQLYSKEEMQNARGNRRVQSSDASHTNIPQKRASQPAEKKRKLPQESDNAGDDRSKKRVIKDLPKASTSSDPHKVPKTQKQRVIHDSEEEEEERFSLPGDDSMAMVDDALGGGIDADE